MLTHLAVLALVALSAFLANGRSLPVPSQSTRTVAAGPTSSVGPIPTPGVSDMARPLETAASTAEFSGLDRADVAAVTSPVEPSQEEPLVQALSVAVELRVDLLALGLEEGVGPVRAMASSRGGSRSLDPTPTPLPTPTAVPTAASRAAPTPAPKKEPLKPLTYKVAPSDTLLGIASRFGITPETILWANDLGNGELLQVDQELTILPVSGILHKVQKGDTLNSIAEQYASASGTLVDANLIPDADLLQEGQLIVVPGGMRRTEAISGLPSAPSAQDLAAAPRYTVKQGDTLLSIADAFGVRASVIQVANGLLNPDLLQVGRQLAIPGGRQTPATPRAQPAPPVAQPPKAAPAATRPPAPADPARRLQPPAPSAPDPEPELEAADTGGDRIASLAGQYLGYRYLWGGHSPKTGFDCSGFTWYVYKEAGINIPLHDLAGQINAGPRISRDRLLPGDLVFFQNTYKPGLSHSGLYLGGGRFINAETEAVGVQIRSLSDPYWAARYVGASRPW